LYRFCTRPFVTNIGALELIYFSKRIFTRNFSRVAVRLRGQHDPLETNTPRVCVARRIPLCPYIVGLGPGHGRNDPRCPRITSPCLIFLFPSSRRNGLGCHPPPMEVPAQVPAARTADPFPSVLPGNQRTAGVGSRHAPQPARRPSSPVVFSRGRSSGWVSTEFKLRRVVPRSGGFAFRRSTGIFLFYFSIFNYILKNKSDNFFKNRVIFSRANLVGVTFTAATQGTGALKVH
jgi:hypothetical protein